MSNYNSIIEQNNTELERILESAEALPDVKLEQTKTATPSLSQQTIVPDSGKTLSGVTVEPITSALLTSLDSDFKAENIAEGVNMFGLDGTMPAGASVETCTVVVNVMGNTIYNTGLSGLWAFCYSEDYYIADVSDASLETGTVYNEAYGATFNTWKYTVPNVVRNSFVNIISDCGAMVANYSGVSILYGAWDTEALIAITAEAGSTARIELTP